jgi:1-acyl-sn-glycerol-3-phosphate acyltransferase
MSYLRSLLFSIPLIFLSTVFMGAVSLAASFFDPTGNSQHRIARVWARMLLAVSFIHVRAEGLDKLDPHGSYVFVANHASFMDIPAILARLPYQFRFFAKKSLYGIPFLGTHLRRAGHLPVERSSPRASLKSMTESGRLIAHRGVSVLLFPEGGRSPHGLRDFKDGAAYIAIKAGVPVVPIAIVGMRPLLPMGSIHIRRGNVLLRVGDPIPTADLKPSGHTELTQRLYREVSHLLEEPVPSPTR